MTEGVDWKWIEMISKGIEYDYTGMYRIYRDGKVESVKRFRAKQRFLKVSPDRCGYKQASLYKDNKTKVYFIHRLVACHFIPNPHNFPQVDHINERKDDNSISNLRWCLMSTNIRNRTKNRPKHDLPRGVDLTSSGKYRVKITINYKYKHLGCYDTKEEASRIYEEARRETEANELNTTNKVT